MNVDLKLLEECGQCAVRCTSADQAEAFMNAMWDQYPEKVKRVWRKGQTNWHDYGYDKLGEIFYKPRIVVVQGKDYVDYCQSAKRGTVEKEGYLIVEFLDLLHGLDLGEISVGEHDIESLFGMG